MPLVEITIRSTPYTIACDADQEPHLHTLATRLDERISTLSRSAGKGSNDVRLLVLAALMLEDQVAELQSRLAKMPVAGEENRGNSVVSMENEADVAVSRTMEAITDRLEKIALQLETI